jgi:hypothetical protein
MRSQATQQAPTSLPRLSGLEVELLLVAYVHQFNRGEDTRPVTFDWQLWAHAAGLSEQAALAPLRRLAERRLVDYDDPDGHRIRLSLAGVFKAEKCLLAEPTFVARQRGLRRQILMALALVRNVVGDVTGGCTGRTLEWLAAELKEPVGDVAANCAVLRTLGFISGGDAPLTREASTCEDLVDIAEDGLHALANGWGWTWPLN